MLRFCPLTLSLFLHSLSTATLGMFVLSAGQTVECQVMYCWVVTAGGGGGVWWCVVVCGGGVWW